MKSKSRQINEDVLFSLREMLQQMKAGLEKNAAVSNSMQARIIIDRNNFVEILGIISDLVRRIGVLESLRTDNGKKRWIARQQLDLYK